MKKSTLYLQNDSFQIFVYKHFSDFNFRFQISDLKFS